MNKTKSDPAITPPAPPPLVLMDTSVFVDYNTAQSAKARAPSMKGLIDALLADDARSIVITRRQFTELFQGAQKRLIDLVNDKQGHLVLPPGLGPEDFKIPDSYRMYTMFQKLATDGKLVTYPSREAMIDGLAGNAGKFIIVDTFKSPDEKTLKDIGVTEKEYYAWFINTNRGDDAMVSLVQPLVEHLEQVKRGEIGEAVTNYSLAVLNNDAGLNDRIALALKERRTDIQPCYLRSRSALEALANCGAVTSDFFDHYHGALSRLSQEERDNPTRFDAESSNGADWLGVTTHIAQAIAEEQAAAAAPVGVHTARHAAQKSNKSAAGRGHA